MIQLFIELKFNYFPQWYHHGASKKQYIYLNMEIEERMFYLTLMLLKKREFKSFTSFEHYILPTKTESAVPLVSCLLCVALFFLKTIKRTLGVNGSELEVVLALSISGPVPSEHHSFSLTLSFISPRN